VADIPQDPDQGDEFFGVDSLASRAETALPHPDRRHVLDPVGLVAGLCDALSLGAVMDRATRHPLDTRIVTPGEAVTAMVLHSHGGVNPPRDLVSRLCQDHPTARRLAPRVIDAHHRQAAARGRAFATREV